MDFHDLTERLVRIYTPRLAIRPVCVADTWPLFNATRAPAFNKHLLWSQPDADEAVVQRLDAICAMAGKGRLAAVSAVVRETGAWVSLFRFQPYNGNPDLLEMGIWTHPDHWHGRLSLELGKACVDAAFEFSGTQQLIGAASPDNKSSCKLMTLCGLSQTSLVRRPHEAGGEVELLEHSITRSAWISTQRRSAFKSLPFPRSGASAVPRAATLNEPSPAASIPIVVPGVVKALLSPTPPSSGSPKGSVRRRAPRRAKLEANANQLVLPFLT